MSDDRDAPELDDAVQATAEPPVPAPVRIQGYDAPLTREWSLSAAFGVVIFNLVLNGLLAMFVWSEVVTLPQEGVARSVVLSGLLVVPYLLTIAVVWLMLRRRGWGWSEGVGLRAWYVWSGVGIALVLALLGRVASIWWAGMLAGLGLEPPASLDVTAWFPDDPVGIIALVLITVVVAPIVEETVFRGMLYPSLRDHFGRRWGVVISSIVFGVAHLSFVWLLVPTAIIGVLLALIFEWTRSLKAPIVTHAFFNMSALVIVFALREAGVI